MTAPIKSMYRFGERLGTVAYHCAGRYQQIGLQNIMSAYPEMSEREARELLKHVFRNFGVSTVEFLMADRFSDQMMSEMVVFVNEHYLQEAYALGEGVLLISAHMGSWELCARALTRLQSIPLTVVARDADDPGATSLVNAIRGRSGYKVIPKGGSSGIKIIRALKDKDAVVLMSDQNSDDVFVPFFGRMAGCVAGPARLALRTHGAIVPLFARRCADGTHIYEFREPIIAAPTGDNQADVLRITAEIQRVIESQVRLYPDQWLWFHNRWKCRPPEEAITSES